MRNPLKRFVLQTFNAFGRISREVALAQHSSTPVTELHNWASSAVQKIKMLSESPPRHYRHSQFRVYLDLYDFSLQQSFANVLKIFTSSHNPTRQVFKITKENDL